jgi:uncharacterized protein YgbK (DUF1537 family)
MLTFVVATTSAGVPTRKNISELNPATKEFMQSALGIKFVYLDTWRSTTAGHLARRTLELRRATTATSVAQLQSYLQAVQVEALPQNHHIFEHSTISDDSILNASDEALRIIPCTEVKFVNGERTPTHKTCFPCPHNIIYI